MKKLLEDKNKLLKICGCLLAVILLVVLLFKVFGGTSQEKKLENRLKELGKVYYEKYYGLFNDEKARKEFLAKYSTLGIKVDLENLARTVADTNDLPSKDKILKEFVNKKTKKSCNQTTTKVIFYPQDPYGKKDYKMEINLECGF